MRNSKALRFLRGALTKKNTLNIFTSACSYIKSKGYLVLCLTEPCLAGKNERTILGILACSMLDCSSSLVWASLVAQLVKNPPAMWDTWVQSLGWKDPLEKGMATHSCIFAWRIPWTEWNLEGYSPWGHKESATTE